MYATTLAASSAAAAVGAGRSAVAATPARQVDALDCAALSAFGAAGLGTFAGPGVLLLAAVAFGAC